MEKELLKHIEILKKHVFQVSTKWPQFNLLLNDIEKFYKNSKASSTIVSLERNLLYGGNSLIAPIFHKHKYISVDCSPSSADKRGAYNKKMIDYNDFIKVPSSLRCDLNDINLDNNIADLLLVPNLVHHIADQQGLFKEVNRILKIGASLYVFEPLVREIHQDPDDFIRYTPSGLKNVLEKLGFHVEDTKLEGGPFQVISYCWQQALEYLPEDKRVSLTKWFEEEHFHYLLELDNKYKNNLIRNNTSFPAAFSVTAKKIKSVL